VGMPLFALMCKQCGNWLYVKPKGVFVGYFFAFSTLILPSLFFEPPNESLSDLSGLLFILFSYLWPFLAVYLIGTVYYNVIAYYVDELKSDSESTTS
jgi:hypothetical protein